MGGRCFSPWLQICEMWHAAGEWCVRLQQAVILGVLSFFMVWVVQSFFASVLLDIVNAGVYRVILSRSMSMIS